MRCCHSSLMPNGMECNTVPTIQSISILPVILKRLCEIWLFGWGWRCFTVITVEKDGEGHKLLFLCFN